MAKTFRIAIVGGGVGGLTLAVALRQRGIEVDVYEQAQELAEIGAAVALSANSTRELRRLGMGDALATVSTEPGELIYRNWRDGSRIAAHPVHENMNYQKICGAPYYGIHRADLQRILGGALGGAGLHLDHRLTEIRDLGGAAGLSFANGRTIEADLVVGADGVRSVVRRFITGGDDTVYSGTSAFRGIVPVDKLPALPDPGAIQFWMGPDAHLLHYAIGGNADYVNFFAVVEYPKVWPHADKWLDSIQPGEAAAAFAGWHPAVVEMVAQHLPVRWGLFGTRPLLNWHRGRVVSSATPRTLCCRITGKAPTPPSRTRSPWRNSWPGPRWTGSVRCWRNTSHCDERGPAKSNAAPGLRIHCYICRMVRNSRNAISGWRGSRKISAGSTSSTRSKQPMMRRRHSVAPLPRTPEEVSMQQTEIETAFAELVENITGTQPARIDRDLHLDKLGLDSLSKIDLAVAAEDRFGIAIPDEDLERFVVVGDLLDYVQRNRA